jgi:hypothetical protein
VKSFAIETEFYHFPAPSNTYSLSKPSPQDYKTGVDGKWIAATAGQYRSNATIGIAGTTLIGRIG